MISAAECRETGELRSITYSGCRFSSSFVHQEVHQSGGGGACACSPNISVGHVCLSPLPLNLHQCGAGFKSQSITYQLRHCDTATTNHFQPNIGVEVSAESFARTEFLTMTTTINKPPHAKKRRLNYLKCEFCRKSKKTVRRVFFTILSTTRYDSVLLTKYLRTYVPIVLM